MQHCRRCENQCSRFATLRHFNQLVRAAVECCALPGLFRGQTLSRSFGPTAAENAESGSQRLPTTAPLGVLRAARNAKLGFPVEVHAPPRQPQAPLSPGAWGPFFRILGGAAMPKLGNCGILKSQALLNTSVLASDSTISSLTIHQISNDGLKNRWGKPWDRPRSLEIEF